MKVKYGSILRNISAFSESFLRQYAGPEWPIKKIGVVLIVLIAWNR